MNAISTDVYSTEEVLQSIFTEDTGINLLDSGGTIGRHWQRNATREFINKPSAYVEYETVRLSTYHYLLKRLEYSRFQTDQFRYMFPDASDRGMAEMVDYILNCGLESGGEVFNTYNFDTLLDQDIQYVEFQIEGLVGAYQTYVILQVHNGADPRGGYTDPVIFKANEYWIYQCNDVSLWCSDCGIPVYSFGGDISQPVQSVDVKSKITLAGGQEKVTHYYETFDVDRSIIWEAKCPSCHQEMVAEAPDPENSF